MRDQSTESGALYRTIRQINAEAPVTRSVGDRAHSREMHTLARLPLVLVRFGLIRLDEPLTPAVAGSQGPSLGSGGRSGSVQGAAGTVAG